jgi:hypothetical protein
MTLPDNQRSAKDHEWCGPTILPVTWRQLEPGLYISMGDLKVLCSKGRERDGRRWLHVSVSHPARLPRWTELREVKDLFVGLEAVALQVLPRASEYVNVHPYVLHLWSCLDGEVVPDFRALLDGEAHI